MTARPTALIAEDEAPQRRELRALLAKLWPELEIIAECADGLDALERLADASPDVAFLDIRMPGVSGLEVARQASGASHIVFITAYDEFALKAFEAGVIDYLLKPIKPERLATTIERLQERLRGGAPQNLDALVSALSGQLAKTPQISWITATAGENVKMIPIEDVLYFQSEDKYTRVVTGTDSAHIRTPLKDLLGQLDSEAFWQVHRNAIVRVAAIRAVKRDEDGKLRLTLRGRAETIRVSDAFRRRFRTM
ncbi:MAG: LytTR family DNA-binding domain-containing protein [Pseudomonadota bacterium]